VHFSVELDSREEDWSEELGAEEQEIPVALKGKGNTKATRGRGTSRGRATSTRGKGATARRGSRGGTANTRGAARAAARTGNRGRGAAGAQVVAFQPEGSGISQPESPPYRTRNWDKRTPVVLSKARNS
jgi:hypothetical protein